MARISGISTQTNSKITVIKNTLDFKKVSATQQALTQIELTAKNYEDLEREAFYKEFNDPTNETLDECFDYVHKEIATWKWEK